MKKDSVIVYSALIITVILWGSSFVAVKIVLQSIPPSAYMFLRFTAASLVFLVILHRKNSINLGWRNHLKLFAVAFFEPGLYFIFETAGIQRTSASSAAIIIGAVPAAVALSAAVFLKEKTGPKGWTGIILSIAGIILLTLFDKGGSTDSAATIAGNVLVFMAVIAAAGYMITVKKVAPDFNTLEITGWQIIYGALIFLPFFIKDLNSISWINMTAQSISALLFLILFATLTAFVCYNFALTKIEASKAAMFINGIPLVAVIVSALVLKETISAAQITAGIFIISGVTLANLDSRNRTDSIKKRT